MKMKKRKSFFIFNNNKIFQNINMNSIMIISYLTICVLIVLVGHSQQRPYDGQNNGYGINGYGSNGRYNNPGYDNYGYGYLDG